MDVPVLEVVLAGVDGAMAGVAWVILLCTYPDFARWREEGFARDHADYTRRIGWLVGPLLGAQLAGHLLLWSLAGDLVGMTLVAGGWVLTGGWSVPCHRRLQREGPTSPALGGLIRSHAWRTLVWTALAVHSVVRAAG